MKSVVKTSSIAKFFDDFNSIIFSNVTRSLCRKTRFAFTRDRNMTFYNLIYYLIFRHCDTTNTDLSAFYSALSLFDKRISKQALHKGMQKLNPNVFSYLIKQFATLFYSSNLSKTFKGYTLIGEDGTFIEIPYNVLNIYHYQFTTNQHVHDMFDVKKVSSKAGGLYDITNGMFIDFSMRPAPYSETPLAFEHLYRTTDMLKNKKVLYLADRYYGSAEIISHLESLDYKYCIRGKSNFYKAQVASMKTNDEWIEVAIDEKWLNRFRFSPEAILLRKQEPIVKIRVVKYNYQYKNQKDEEIEEELIFFTNLSEEEFSTGEILSLYSKRWDLEVSYKTLKTKQELERYVSADGDVAKCCVLAKVIFHNIAGVVRKELNQYLEETKAVGRKQYVVNISQLQEIMIHTNILSSMLYGKKLQTRKILNSIVGILDKIKVPIRPDRHYKRWGRIITSAPSYRFRLDGRNHPKVRRYKGVLMTISP